jgi:ubiquinone/menaquinone biosynthesis C-methylase UbiE
MTEVIGRFSRHKRHLVIYDQLNPAYVKYYRQEETRQLFERVQPLLEGIRLEWASVADLACGSSGHNSLALRAYFPSIHTTGYDISEKACRQYRSDTGAVTHLVDPTKPYSPDQSHDAALVIGGLHHCVMDLSTTLKNVARIVRPGGHPMMEPSDDSLLSGLRRVWYRADRWFEAYY